MSDNWDFVAIVLFSAVALVFLLANQLSTIKKKQERDELEWQRIQARKKETELRKLQEKNTLKIENETHNERPKTAHAPNRTEFQVPVISKAYEDIECIKIPTTFNNLRPVSGKFEHKDEFSNIYYDVDLDKQTCTCDRFVGGKNCFPPNHLGRICSHLCNEMNKQHSFDDLHHLARAACFLATREETRSAYAIKHQDLPLMYIIVGKNDDWINIYSREKLAKQSVYEASGDFERFGWSCTEKRWSYGVGNPGASLLRHFLKAIDAPADLDRIATPITMSTEPEAVRRKLSERSDPRKNPNVLAEQFGPAVDAWEIPESFPTYAISLRIALKFRYVDHKGQDSRRTVNLKEIQFYGNEGEFIYGECRMRHAGRTFKTSRMWDVTDADTGEIIEDVSKYLKAAYEDSSLGRLREWFVEFERIGKAWLFLLKANKKPGEYEYGVLKEAFSHILGGSQVTTRDIQDLYENTKVTTPAGFQKLVGGIKTHHSEWTVMFATVCHKLVKVKANPNFADEAALNYVLSKIPLKD